MSSLSRGDTVLVRCSIEAGAFSGERVFRLPTADGIEYSGTAPRHYCLDAWCLPLVDGCPGSGELMEGYVESNIVTVKDDYVIVRFPSGDSYPVRPESVRFKVVSVNTVRYEPIGEARP